MDNNETNKKFSIVDKITDSNIIIAELSSSNKLFAIKKLSIMLEHKCKVLEDLDFITKLSNNFTVKVHEFSLIKSTNSKSKNKIAPEILELKIIMDYHKFNLTNAVAELDDYESPYNYLSLSGLYVASQLFIELVDALNYLHSQSVPIIHGNLKLSNILMNTDRDNNGKFIRLTDFGALNYNYNDKHLRKNIEYATSDDIYSLGVIMQLLFKFDINKNIMNKIFDHDMKIMYEKISTLCKSLVQDLPQNRPKCSQIFDEINFLQLTAQQIRYFEFEEVFYRKLDDISFIDNFIQRKYPVLFLEVKRRVEIKKRRLVIKEISPNFTEKEFSDEPEELSPIDLMEKAYSILTPEKFNNNFNQICKLGLGQFSTVYKAISKHDSRVFAVKKIPFDDQKFSLVMRELKFLSKLNKDFVVEYLDSWIEDNYETTDVNTEMDNSNVNFEVNKKTKLPLLLHIQMELCPLTLRDVITELSSKCLNSEGKLTCIGYYIASELFFELIECIDYLHRQTPPIMHRDLKPENILIIKNNNRFVKVADFGLSTYHEFVDQTHTKYIGTVDYRAPEINFSVYSPSIDVYSLGIITQQIFHINLFKSERTEFFDERIIPCIKNLYILVENLLQTLPENRPKCSQILPVKTYLTLNYQRLSEEELKMFNKQESPDKEELTYENFFAFFLENFVQQTADNSNIDINSDFKKALFS